MGDILLRIHFLCLLCIYGLLKKLRLRLALPHGASTARNDYKKGVIARIHFLKKWILV
ncbi:hypothetical protein [Helicobacter canis]|uniref:hypothetical protein n=1 Tax=Helicobacter canis TaxID=29419 RepID=UPI0015F0C41A|nr:hypothetical protein [Helicobacter canis]